MPKLTILRGLPGSGKSTVARDMAKASGNTVRLNRDELRAMMWDHWTGKREGTTKAVERQTAICALAGGYSVLIDDTNLNAGTVQSWKNLALDAGAKFEIVDLTDVPLETCIQRDLDRFAHGGRLVGPAVITRMAFENGLIQPPPCFVTPPAVDSNGTMDIMPKVETRVVVVDLDGTLSDLDHRLKYIKECKNCGRCVTAHFYCDPATGVGYGCPKFQKDWKSFFAAVADDNPKTGTVLWVRALKEAGYTIIICSARGEETQLDTWNWLKQYGVPFDYLLMRRAGDHRDDLETKRELMGLIGTQNVAFCIDDRKKIVELYRSMGLKVYPVNGEGNY